jgi:hypothetical protein
MNTLAIRNACLVFALLFCGAVRAQYLTIERRGDPNGLCGSPGLAACETIPTCTDPESNILRDDKYTGKILCNLPGRSLDIDEAFECPGQLRNYKFGQIQPSDTFFTSTDLHFGKSTVSDEDHVRHITMMNNFAAAGVHWPRGVGFPDEPIHRPAAIITSGDKAHDGQVPELGAYRLLYEQGLISESTKIPVFIGLGNHDVGNDCGFNNCAKRMFDYVTDHNACGASLDTGSDNYSWDWNGVHFVQLNKWAGDTELGSKTTDTHASGLQWLKDDLSKNVGHSRKPVIFFQHYGLDTFSTNGWWLQPDRETFWAAIRNYNVIGMFTGHIHSTGIYDFSIADSGPETHIDDFVGGTGGEDPCLNVSDTACGGRGHFFAVRTSKMFLDVASLEWKSSPGGGNVDATPQFTNLAPPSWDPKHNDTVEGPAFALGQKGCRKIINQRLIDVSSLASATGSGPITVTNSSSLSIPGPLALGISGITGSTCNLPTDTTGCNYSDWGLPPDVTNKSFVDRCVDTAAAPSTAFLFANNGSPITLPPSDTLSFSPAFTSTPVALAIKLYRVSPWKGARPNALDLVVQLRSGASIDSRCNTRRNCCRRSPYFRRLLSRRIACHLDRNAPDRIRVYRLDRQRGGPIQSFGRIENQWATQRDGTLRCTHRNSGGQHIGNLRSARPSRCAVRDSYFERSAAERRCGQLSNCNRRGFRATGARAPTEWKGNCSDQIAARTTRRNLFPQGSFRSGYPEIRQ